MIDSPRPWNLRSRVSRAALRRESFFLLHGILIRSVVEHSYKFSHKCVDFRKNTGMIGGDLRAGPVGVKQVLIAKLTSRHEGGR